LYQFSLVFGILLAFVSNYLLSGIGENDWRWMMGVEAFPAIFYTLLCFRIPRSPRWLISSGLLDEAKTVFMQIDPEGSFDQLVNEINENSNKTSSEESIFDEKYRFPLKLAFLVAFFNQLSGINAFLYYAPRIFEEGKRYKMNFKPLHDRVLVERIESSGKTKGGIILPDSAREKPMDGLVVAVGEGIVNDKGVLTSLDLKKGDKVLFAKWGGTEVKIDGKEYMIMKESDILGKYI
jgi:co-chaperonin GroES (HSP10)